MQCDDYIQDHDINIGCVLQNLSQAEYKDLNICVNGSVAATLLRPLYVTLRLHNLGNTSRKALGLFLGTRMATTHPRLTSCTRGLKQMCALVDGWL